MEGVLSLFLITILSLEISIPLVFPIKLKELFSNVFCKTSLSISPLGVMAAAARP